MQEEEQVCIPPLPQLCVAPAAHTPVPVHVPQLPLLHVPVLVLHVTVLVCVPQLPHVWLSAGFVEVSQLTVHALVSHAPHTSFVQVLVLLPVPLSHAALSVFVPLQEPHAPLLHVPVLVLHVTVLVLVPQLVQFSLVAGFVEVSQFTVQELVSHAPHTSFVQVLVFVPVPLSHAALSLFVPLHALHAPLVQV